MGQELILNEVAANYFQLRIFNSLTWQGASLSIFALFSTLLAKSDGMEIIFHYLNAPVVLMVPDDDSWVVLLRLTFHLFIWKSVFREI